MIPVVYPGSINWFYKSQAQAMAADLTEVGIDFHLGKNGAMRMHRISRLRCGIGGTSATAFDLRKPRTTQDVDIALAAALIIATDEASVARDDAGADSDVDILVEFEGPATFDRYMDLKFFLEELLECRIDLVTRDALKPRIRPRVESEAIHVA